MKDEECGILSPFLFLSKQTNDDEDGSARMDLIVRNAKICTDGIEMRADLGVVDGCVAALGMLDGVEARESVDASGCIVFPGAVDVGVSLLAENAFHAGCDVDFGVLTRMAAVGGATTIVVAAEWETEKKFEDQLERRVTADQRKAFVDFGYHVFANAWSLQHRETALNAVQSGVCSVWVARTDGLANLPGGALAHAVVRDLTDSMVAIVSPTDPVLEEYFRNSLRSLGSTGLMQRTNIFPEPIEATAMRTFGALVKGSRAHVAFLGVSGERTMQALEYLRSHDYPASAIAKLPHLAFNADTLGEESQSPVAPGIPSVWPPLRGRQHQQRLWTALDSGLVTAVSSGHHPITMKQATAGLADATRAAEGANGLEHLVPVMYSEGVSKWRIDGETLSNVCCADPAKLAGLYPRKGSLQVGSDADFVIVDPAAAHERRPFPNAGHYDFFAGMDCMGTMRAVYLRGSRIAGDGARDEPAGRFVERRVSLA